MVSEASLCHWLVQTSRSLLCSLRGQSLSWVGADEPLSPLWSQRPVSVMGWCRRAALSSVVSEASLCHWLRDTWCRRATLSSVVSEASLCHGLVQTSRSLLCGLRGQSLSLVEGHLVQTSHSLLCSLRGQSLSLVGADEPLSLSVVSEASLRHWLVQTSHSLLCGLRGQSLSLVGAHEPLSPLWSQRPVSVIS